MCPTASLPRKLTYAPESISLGFEFIKDVLAAKRKHARCGARWERVGDAMRGKLSAESLYNIRSRDLPLPTKRISYQLTQLNRNVSACSRGNNKRRPSQSRGPRSIGSTPCP